MLGCRLADSERIEFVSEDFGGCGRDGNAACGGGEAHTHVQVQIQVHFAIDWVQVVEVVAAHRQLKKISFVAHSMGGLVARYAIGLLYVPPGARPTSTRLPLANTCVADVDGGPIRSGRGDVGEGPSAASEPQENAEEEGSRNLPSGDEDGDGNGDGVKVVRDIEEEVMMESHDMQERWGSRDGGTIAGLTPVNFVTIATPHLGCLGKGHVRG